MKTVRYGEHLRELRKPVDRYLDMQLEVRVLGTEEQILSVGGRWDREERRYVGNAERALVVYLQPAQLEAARWFARWLRGYLTGKHDKDTARVWSVLLAGDRRSGKGDCSLKFVVAFLVAVAGGDHVAIAWVVSSTMEKNGELRTVLDKLIPSEWAEWNEEDKCYYFAHGGQLWMRSAHRAKNLKQGRVDLALLNEAQEMSQVAYAMIRPAVSDTGGLVVTVANPPDRPIGQWVLDFYEAVKSGKRRSRLFEFQRKLNPFVHEEAMADLKDEIDELTFRRDVMNEWIPIGDKVFYAWSPKASVVARPSSLVDVTRDFTERKLGRAHEWIMGFDFQLTPHMPAVIYKAYRDPEDPGGEPLLWIVDYTALEQADEDELLDELDRRGYERDATAVIPDASGEWQDAERTKGRGSLDVFRRRGWRWIYLPDANSKRNPNIMERAAVMNARIRDANGKRRLFSEPTNELLNRALREWGNKGGVPDRRSRWAHLCDAASYPIYRLYPRKNSVKASVEYERIDVPRDRTLDGYL